MVGFYLVSELLVGFLLYCFGIGLDLELGDEGSGLFGFLFWSFWLGLLFGNQKTSKFLAEDLVNPVFNSLNQPFFV